MNLLQMKGIITLLLKRFIALGKLTVVRIDIIMNIQMFRQVLFLSKLSQAEMANVVLLLQMNLIEMAIEREVSREELIA